MSILSIRRPHLSLRKITPCINPKEMTILPYCIMLCDVVTICMALADLEMQMLSYLCFAGTVAGFFLMAALLIRSRVMSRFIFLFFLFFLTLISLTVISGTNIKAAVYIAIDTTLLAMLADYYKLRMRMLIIGLGIVLSFCVYMNLLHMLTHPTLWLIDTEKEGKGYLLGNNYNQMGCRMIVSLITAYLCTVYSRWWKVNFIALAVAVVTSLALVGSMTSLTMIILFLTYCLIPSAKLRRIGIFGLLIVFLLFQVFVVFNGNGLENNDLAVYIVEDVLHKDITFTHRTFMWASAIKVIGQSPVWGWGMVDGDWFASHMTSFAIGPHDFILSVLINGGIILLAVYVIICVKALRYTWPYIDERQAQVLIFGTFTLWFMGLMEMYPYSIMFIPLLLLWAYPYYKHNAGKHE